MAPRFLTPEMMRVMAGALDAVSLEVDDDEAAQLIARRADQWRAEADEAESWPAAPSAPAVGDLHRARSLVAERFGRHPGARLA